MTGKTGSIALLVMGEIAGMSLWFTSAAVLPDMVAEAAIPVDRQAWLSTGVQAGFVLGALAVAVTGIADRYDPRRVFAASAIAAALANVSLLQLPIGGDMAILARAATGALLAGVYPVGMKIAVGWGVKDRGFIVGLIVGAIVLGNSTPYLVAFLGGAAWRLTVTATSLLAVCGGLLVLLCGLGPHHATAPAFSPRAILLAWKIVPVRRAYLGYLGHMWELFAMAAWVGAATGASYAMSMSEDASVVLAKATAFVAIAIGAPASIVAGAFADWIGKAEVSVLAMATSGTAVMLTALSFGGPPWLTFVLVMVWGVSIIPDSAQFSAIVADHSPPDVAGSLLTLQTALGFTLTIATVQIAPLAAAAFGWPVVLAALAIGPALGIVAMWPLMGRRARPARGAS